MSEVSAVKCEALLGDPRRISEKPIGESDHVIVALLIRRSGHHAMMYGKGIVVRTDWTNTISEEARISRGRPATSLLHCLSDGSDITQMMR